MATCFNHEAFETKKTGKKIPQNGETLVFYRGIPLLYVCYTIIITNAILHVLVICAQNLSLVKFILQGIIQKVHSYR